MNLDIVVSSDDNYVQHLMGMLCSLYEHNKNHHIVLHMLRNGSLLQENEDFLRGITEKYGHEIKFLDPIELKVKYAIEDTENKTYNDKFKRDLMLDLDSCILYLKDNNINEQYLNNLQEFKDLLKK